MNEVLEKLISKKENFNLLETHLKTHIKNGFLSLTSIEKNEIETIPLEGENWDSWESFDSWGDR